MKLFNAMQMSYGQYSTAVKSYLSKTFSNFSQKYNNSTVFGQLITVMEATVQNIMLYIEDAFVEQNKFTAVRKKSIYGLAQMSGYNPSLGKSAGLQVKLSYIPTNNNSLGVIINNHERLVCNQNGLQYNIILPQDAIIMDITKDNSNKFLYAVEGEFETQSFVSTGGKLYMEHVNFIGDIDDDYIEVKVNNELWERAASLYDMVPDGKQWYYKTSVQGGIIVGFGNDVHGRALKEGDEFTVTYLKHAGEYGNLNNQEVIRFVFVDPLKNIAGDEVDGNSMFHITPASQDGITSGTFSESQDQVKQMIGYNSRAMVLASPENYKAFISRFSFCGYNHTWSEKGSLVVNSLIMRNYKNQLKDGLDYFKLTEKDFVLSESQKESISNCIKNSGNQLAGATYNIIDPQLCKYALFVYVKMKQSSYDHDYVENRIRKVVGEFFANIKHDDYIPKSDIIQVIKNEVPEVDGINCYFLSERNEDAIINKHYTETTTVFNPSTGTYDKKIEDVYLYDGEDPGVGLDAHGNIYLSDNSQYPVLMGGWQYISSKNNSERTTIIEGQPLVITFEN